MQRGLRHVNRSECAVGIALAAFATFVAVYALPPGSLMEVGLPAWFFPLVSMIIVGGGGLLVAALSLRYGPQMLDGRKSLFLAKRVVVPVGVIAVTGVLMPILGTWIVGPVMIALLMLWMGERSIKRLIATAVLFPLAVVAFAAFVLGTPLP